MASPTTRLRRAVRYPSEDSDSDPAELDEEHQDRLIASLAAEDAHKTVLYRKVFFAFPMFAMAYTLCTVLTVPTTHSRLLPALSISSLLCTSYIQIYLPLRAPEGKGKKALWRVEAEKGPLERYAVYLNGLLVALTLVAAGGSWRRGRVPEAWSGTLPGIVFVLVMVVRWLLAPVDVEELKRARYGLKGA